MPLREVSQRHPDPGSACRSWCCRARRHAWTCVPCSMGRAVVRTIQRAPITADFLEHRTMSARPRSACSADYQARTDQSGAQTLAVGERLPCNRKSPREPGIATHFRDQNYYVTRMTPGNPARSIRLEPRDFRVSLQAHRMQAQSPGHSATASRLSGRIATEWHGGSTSESIRNRRASGAAAGPGELWPFRIGILCLLKQLAGI